MAVECTYLLLGEFYQRENVGDTSWSLFSVSTESQGARQQSKRRQAGCPLLLKFRKYNAFQADQHKEVHSCDVKGKSHIVFQIKVWRIFATLSLLIKCYFSFTYIVLHVGKKC